MPTHKGTTRKISDIAQDARTCAKDGTERVIASGDRLTIETIASFAEQVRDGLAEATTVVIEFTGEVEFDITALQLFCSACKTATAMEKNFIRRGPVPQSLRNLAAAAGAEGSEHCKNNNTSCFRQFGGME